MTKNTVYLALKLIEENAEKHLHSPLVKNNFLALKNLNSQENTPVDLETAELVVSFQ